MGQAKQRGNFEQRKAEAVRRNEQFAAQVPPDSAVGKIVKRRGAHRAFNLLLMAGIFARD